MVSFPAGEPESQMHEPHEATEEGSNPEQWAETAILFTAASQGTGHLCRLLTWEDPDGRRAGGYLKKKIQKDV